MPVQTNIEYELTDTFGGEANYAWVRRGVIETKPGESFSDLAAVRRVKKALEMSGVRCDSESDADSITLRPHGLHQIIFITFHEFGNASS